VTLLLVALGAAVGAPLRYLTDRAIQARHDSVFPWGTLIVNMASSLLVGSLADLPTNPAVTALISTGFCGALSTYSTFSYETLRLAQAGCRFYALVNITASIIAGLGAAACGLMLAHSLTGH
jgi:fluoride exporter